MGPEPLWTSYLAGSPNQSALCSSCEPCLPHHEVPSPGSSKLLQAPFPDLFSVLTRPLPGGSRLLIILPCYGVFRSSLQHSNKFIKPFPVSECSLHVGQVGGQNYDTMGYL
ncbi:hypothetical protein ILYODFUR_030293 [Ilyodon furcidens]|uniref:Uncharacterized protein n=1 Tax=Ilyodon furcidens TaxID=33524 RepID=A0ABV0SR81_9TELE